MQMLMEKRKAKGLTRAALAKKIGVNPQQIFNWEKEKSPIPMRWVAKIVSTLGISEKQLVKAILDIKTKKILAEL